MKKIILLVGVVIVLMLAFPKFMQLSVERDLNTVVDAINSSEEETGYSLTLGKFDSGWFSSTADVYIEFDPYFITGFDVLGEALGVNVMLHLQYGPFLTLNGLGLGRLAFQTYLDQSLAREILTYPAEESLYQLEGQINLWGAISYTDSVPRVSSKDNTLSFGGWNGRGDLTPSETSFEGQIHSVSLEVGAGNLRLKPFILKMTYQDSFHDIFTGRLVDTNTEIKAGYLRVTNSFTNEALALRDLSAGVFNETNDNNQLMNFGFSLNVGEVMSSEYSAKEIVVRADLKNLDIATLQKFYTAGGYDVIGENTEEFLPLFSASPEVNVTEISGFTSHGQISGHLLTKLSGITSLPMDLGNPVFWLSKATIDAKLLLEEELVIWLTQEFPLIDPSMLLQFATQQGDGAYELRFELKDSEAILNGFPLAL